MRWARNRLPQSDDRPRGAALSEKLLLACVLAVAAGFAPLPAAAQGGERSVRMFERSRRHSSLAQRAFQNPADGGIVVDEPDIERFRRCLQHGMATR